MKGGFGGRVAHSGILETGVLTNEVWHAQDTTHPARIISEENATKGGKSAHQIGLDGDGGFNPAGIGRAGDDYSSRHDEQYGSCGCWTEDERIHGMEGRAERERGKVV